MFEKGKTAAIITEYYDSSNYGGNLQAYALTRYLNENVICAEQLSYKRPAGSFWLSLQGHKGFWSKLTFFIRKVLQKTWKCREFARVKKRKEIVAKFGRRFVPHNMTVLNDEDFTNLKLNQNSKIAGDIFRYSLFITGSDQVWRTTEKEAYFLTFVPEGRKKISYAASISKDSLDENEQAFFRTALKDFDAISVREKSDVGLISGLCEQPVEWVVDPTLLLTEEQWNDICSPNLYKERYLFCYFLGGEKRPRILAREYARKNGLRLITMPYLTGDYPFWDFRAGRKNEERLFEVSVGDFLSLIRYADAVFTDSFHAVVFSIIFRTQFFVFDRPIAVSMNSRIRSILELCEAPQRFCDTKEMETLQYIEKLQPIDYGRPFEKLEELRDKSRVWLKEILR